MVTQLAAHLPTIARISAFNIELSRQRFQRLESPLSTIKVWIELGIFRVKNFRLSPCLKIRIDIRQSENDNRHPMILRFSPINNRSEGFGILRRKRVAISASGLSGCLRSSGAR